MKIFKKAVAVSSAALLLLGSGVWPYEPADFSLSIVAGAEAQTHDISTGNVVITDSGEHIITGTTTQYYVIVQSGNPTITINNLNITLGGENQCPFEIRSKCTIVLSGENRLICTNQDKGRAGLWINKSSLTIEGSGSLYAEGAGNWAGICVWTFEGDSELIINNGKITAKGGREGAGIGGSAADSGYITINGGTIEAYGGQKAAGIGGGFMGTNRKITINGGTITAQKGSDAPDDIGAGDLNQKGPIEVNGGTINGKDGRTLYNLSYTVTIPSNVQLGNEVQIKVLNQGGISESVKISVSDSQGAGENFCLKNGSETLNYNIKKDSTNIENGGYVMSENITASTEKTATLYFTTPVSSPTYSGEYHGTLTFTISVS